VQSAYSQLVDLLERRSALAADGRQTIAAGQRILDFHSTPGAIKLSTQSVAGRFGRIPDHWIPATEAFEGFELALATIAARACRKISYWPITSRKTASPIMRYPGPVKCT